MKEESKTLRNWGKEDERLLIIPQFPHYIILFSSFLWVLLSHLILGLVSTGSNSGKNVERKRDYCLITFFPFIYELGTGVRLENDMLSFSLRINPSSYREWDGHDQTRQRIYYLILSVMSVQLWSQLEGCKEETGVCLIDWRSSYSPEIINA